VTAAAAAAADADYGGFMTQLSQQWTIVERLTSQ